jgi:hypothetical protein
MRVWSESSVLAVRSMRWIFDLKGVLGSDVSSNLSDL